MEKIIKLSLILLLLISQVSCTDWLNVQPESRVTQDDMFNTQEGFEDALVGLYISMGQASLYGFNLSMGAVDLLAQNYRFKSQHDLEELIEFNYESQSSRNIINKIWEKSYNVIANCNSILDQFKKKSEEGLTDNTYSFVKAEALGLRAYFHFDLLRLFNVSYKNNPEFMGIPFVETFTKYVTKQSTTEQVLDRIISDLLEARDLLEKEDPILKANYRVGLNLDRENENSIIKKDNLGYRPFLQRREYRMNYYAISALLARVYLYKNEKELALEKALEVIQSEKFNFISKEDILPYHEKTYTSEHVFSLHVEELKDISASHFQREKVSNPWLCSVCVDFDKNDIRYGSWLDLFIESNESYLSIDKYERPEDKKEENEYRAPLVPLIKLGEMHLIAAECLAETNIGEANRLFKLLKNARGIGTGSQDILDSQVLVDEIIKEYRRECFAEGQLFYQYKRLNYTSIPYYFVINDMVNMTDEKYTMPFPVNEIKFGGRQN